MKGGRGRGGGGETALSEYVDQYFFCKNAHNPVLQGVDKSYIVLWQYISSPFPLSFFPHLFGWGALWASQKDEGKKGKGEGGGGGGAKGTQRIRTGSKNALKTT